MSEATTDRLAAEPLELAIGPRIAQSIERFLDARLTYPDHQGELDRLQKHLPTLEDVTIDGETIAADLDAACTPIYGDAVRTRVQAHYASLNAGSVLIVDETGDFSWQVVPVSQTSGFRANIEAVRDEQAAIERPVDLVGEVTPELFEAVSHALLHKAYEASLELYEAIPEPADQVFPEKPTLRDRVYYRAIGVQHVPYVPYSAKQLEANPIDTKPISRKARRLMAWIDRVCKHPTRDIIKTVVLETDQERIAATATSTVDQQIAERNMATLGDLKPIAKVRPIGYLSLQEQEDDAGATDVPIEPSEIIASPEDTPTQDLVVETVGRIPLALPWLGEQPLDQTVDSYSFLGNTIHVATGLDHRLAKIAQRARQKLSQGANSEGCTIDAMIQQLAKTIASGVMPYHGNTLNMRNVRVNRNIQRHDALDLQGIPVWYWKERSLTGPRVYFTLRKFSDITQPGQTVPGVGPDSLCIVILGETDKVNQEDVAGLITGISHSTLRKNQVGST